VIAAPRRVDDLSNQQWLRTADSRIDPGLAAQSPMNSSRKVVIVLEGMLRSDRRLVLLVLLGVVIACWAWITPMALDMQGSMSGSSEWMMTDKWDSVHLLLLCAMWIVMMIGMMLPSAAIAVLDLAPSGTPDIDRNYLPRTGLAFMAGYVAVWSGFSVLAFLVQRFLDSAKILSPMMEIQNVRLNMALVAAAGAYQFTPLKRACLRSCRCLAVNVSQSGFHGGVRNGFSCLGCCWALMLLLFVGGVMNLWWILGISIFVLVEKMAGSGWQRSCVTALPTVGAGYWIILAFVRT
jgi:predicted metal-binding membrane protein